MTDAATIVAGLTDLERELLAGSSNRWGSWMFMVGSDLCAKGLGTKRDGSIKFDTPLAGEVIAILKQPSRRARAAEKAAGDNQ